MPSDLSDSTARLAQLVRQIMEERDPLKFDELGAEIWRVLDHVEPVLIFCESDREVWLAKYRRNLSTPQRPVHSRHEAVSAVSEVAAISFCFWFLSNCTTTLSPRITGKRDVHAFAHASLVL